MKREKPWTYRPEIDSYESLIDDKSFLTFCFRRHYRHEESERKNTKVYFLKHIRTSERPPQGYIEETVGEVTFNTSTGEIKTTDDTAFIESLPENFTGGLGRGFRAVYKLIKEWIREYNYF